MAQMTWKRIKAAAESASRRAAGLCDQRGIFPGTSRRLPLRPLVIAAGCDTQQAGTWWRSGRRPEFSLTNWTLRRRGSYSYSRANQAAAFERISLSERLHEEVAAEYNNNDLRGDARGGAEARSQSLHPQMAAQERPCRPRPPGESRRPAVHLHDDLPPQKLGSRHLVYSLAHCGATFTSLAMARRAPCAPRRGEGLNARFRAAQACRPLPRRSALRRHVTRALVGSTSVEVVAPIRRILLIELFEMGAAVMLVPSIRHISGNVSRR